MIRTPRIYSLNDAPIRHLARLGDVVLFVTSLVLIPIRGPLIQNHVVPDEGNGSLQLPSFLEPNIEICNQKVVAITTSLLGTSSEEFCCISF